MLILYNARVHTLDPQCPQAEALAIRLAPENQGCVLALGSLPELKQEFPNAELLDMHGNTVLPGLTDAHVHFRQYSLGLTAVDCDTFTRAECLERVQTAAAVAQPGAWLRGHGWRQNGWAEGFGTAALLDAAAPRNPVYLSAASMHAAWANSAALKAAGITAQTPDPLNGQIQRDASGQATGILFEAAMQLVADAIPSTTLEEDCVAMLSAQSKLWSYGLTGLHDFDRARSFRALQTLRERGELKLRVLKHIPVESLSQAVELGLRSGFGDDLLRLGAVKVFADGALGPRTAAMLDPYESEPENRGMLFVDSEQLLEWGQRAALGGLSMTVHAIGDRAVHEVLDAFEQLRDFERNNGLPARRHRIEHVQVHHPDDQDRLGRLGLVASMQPLHATSDMLAAEKYWGERVQYSYGWKSQLDAGAVLAFGSDAPVESPNPFLGLHAAVTRRQVDGSPGPHGWLPEQRLSLAAALAAFTFGPAYLSGMETKLGRLAPGFLADLLVLDEDPFSIDPHELHHLQPKATMLGGEWVWGN
ncbi:MAG: amidohydrolase [Anaerolineales bacterium]